jgi:hypothetical protein
MRWINFMELTVLAEGVFLLVGGVILRFIAHAWKTWAVRLHGTAMKKCRPTCGNPEDRHPLAMLRGYVMPVLTGHVEAVPFA